MGNQIDDTSSAHGTGLSVPDEGTCLVAEEELREGVARVLDKLKSYVDGNFQQASSNLKPKKEDEDEGPSTQQFSVGSPGDIAGSLVDDWKRVVDPTTAPEDSRSLTVKMTMDMQALSDCSLFTDAPDVSQTFADCFKYLQGVLEDVHMACTYRERTAATHQLNATPQAGHTPGARTSPTTPSFNH